MFGLVFRSAIRLVPS